jgi:peptide chain release factor subunit 1
MSYEKRELEDQFDWLSEVEGRGTSLISLYVPNTDPQLIKAHKLVKTELGAAKNIKDKAVRDAVQSALGCLLHRLKNLTKEEKKSLGVAMFCGIDISNGETMITEVITLPKEISKLSYSCDKSFNLQPIEEALRVDPAFGIVVIDGKGLTIGEICGERRRVLCSRSVDIPKKHGRGGQSAGRFFRTRV